jgi:DNA helicase-2/ATP-dependent DNA helicase PcrA
MMITFTNKAANEILERVSKITPEAYKMWIGTFHKICTRLIRMFGEKLGVKSFTILDTNDAKNLIKEIVTGMGLEWGSYMINTAQSKISEYKSNMIKPTKVLEYYKEDRTIAAIYQEYQNICWKRKSFDFDDLIIYAILLLSSYPEVLDWVHDHIKYVMVDESQDTGTNQYQLVKLIVGSNNLMMVGDVQQSIYGFRNAKPQYLAEFCKLYPNSKKMFLERNYRSTQTIINAANAVISNNRFGDKVNMTCPNAIGSKVGYCQLGDGFQEARWLASEILMKKRSGASYDDFAIIYRANFQSRLLEQEFMAAGIPYVIFGSSSFYSRKEVRDLLAYCKVVVNEYDIESFKRILGTMKGVGKVTVSNILQFMQSNNLTCKNVIEECILNGVVKGTGSVGKQLTALDAILKKDYNKCSDLVEDVLTTTEYKTELEYSYTEEDKQRLEIISEFQQMLKSLEEMDTKETMATIIDQVSLLSDAKGQEKQNAEAVKFMTAHSSKGLEFDTVFIVGCEEGLFPHSNAINSKREENIEEERRLFYVAMTRAKQRLIITRAITRRTDTGNTITSKSRFFKEIPQNLIEELI